ncbi:competence/damage-inducible protein CinA [Thermosulfidibacter takaii ABI70S6]|uniref:CinA-like protein n=1 Tax=Thermosulfidibacter takaii (strain DSM 17441 / JCM 13301 / NBRC 103674 / ABI70S6) TaxID=1298851 RepID=A0A0S3QSQ1_THET7|nr:CinA family nicotinamide mononucleotide deamidase-related protein [Thermosulfidibacter takaii]BAT71324.1 competence/damage-inducible protein CinA [Thermosulfidibacter takaii ABI70S6]
MKSALLFVGDEVVEGLIENTNALFLKDLLNNWGVEVDEVVEVRDDLKLIKEALNYLLAFYDLVFVCGGLGPTEDDLTRKALSEALRLPLQFEGSLWDRIRSVLYKRGVVVREEHKRMAYIPEGADYIENPVGLAPALVIRKDKKVVVALPGVPRELKELSFLVLQKLVGEKKMDQLVRVFKIFGLKESEVNSLVKEIFTTFFVKWGTVIKDGEVWLRVKADPSQIELIEKQVRKAFGNDLFGIDDETLEVVVGKLLRGKGLSLATAESCTGGLLANLITNVSGSSDYFRGGVVAYLEDVKASVLGVSWDSIKKFTVYSHEVAKEMAQGVRLLIKSDIGLSTTGIAGPTGGTPEKPVGLVYVGLATKEGVESFEFKFNFDRVGNKKAFAKAALDVLRRYLIEN